VRALAIILARGGSKGVPRKNVATIAGRPCIAWTIEAALSSTLVGRTVVSTDDEEISQVASRLGAEAIMRPPALASDTAAVDAAARHAVQELEAAAGALVGEPIVILYANVPVRPRDLIDRAVALLLESGCDSVQSYCTVGKHHPWWMARLDEEGRVRPWQGEVLNHGVHRRQDLPPAYIPDGGVLVVSRRALFLEIPDVAPGPHAFFGRDRRGITTEAGEVVDIDAPVDLVVADALLRERSTFNGRGSSTSSTA
jgi:CMP-N,N'-diacetyllegionaminic acid synthase